MGKIARIDLKRTAVKLSLGPSLALFKGLRQANQNPAHKRRVILCVVCMAFNPASREDRTAT